MSYKVGYLSGTYKDVVDVHGTVQRPDIAFEHFGWSEVKDIGNGNFIFRFLVHSTHDTSEWLSTNTPPVGVTDSVVAGINDA